MDASRARIRAELRVRVGIMNRFMNQCWCLGCTPSQPSSRRGRTQRGWWTPTVANVSSKARSLESEAGLSRGLACLVRKAPSGRGFLPWPARDLCQPNPHPACALANREQIGGALRSRRANLAASAQPGIEAKGLVAADAHPGHVWVAWIEQNIAFHLNDDGGSGHPTAPAPGGVDRQAPAAVPHEPGRSAGRSPSSSRTLAGPPRPESDAETVVALWQCQRCR